MFVYFKLKMKGKKNYTLDVFFLIKPKRYVSEFLIMIKP